MSLQSFPRFLELAKGLQIQTLAMNTADRAVDVDDLNSLLWGAQWHYPIVECPYSLRHIYIPSTAKPTCDPFLPSWIRVHSLNCCSSSTGTESGRIEIFQPVGSIGQDSQCFGKLGKEKYFMFWKSV